MEADYEISHVPHFDSVTRHVGRVRFYTAVGTGNPGADRVDSARGPEASRVGPVSREKHT